MIKEAKRPQAAFGLSVASTTIETPTVTLSLPSESSTSPIPTITSSSSESASSPTTSEDETEIKVLMDYDTISPKETRSVLTVLQGVNPTPEENTSDNVITTVVTTDTNTTAANSNNDGNVLKKVCVKFFIHVLLISVSKWCVSKSQYFNF